MTTLSDAAFGKGLRQSSSLAGDAWHAGDHRAGAYEWWYFDAASDDGRDALVIIFLDNFIFSPRYNRTASQKPPESTARTFATHSQFPAVVCCLYRDGRPVIRAINEYTAGDFAADAARPACGIGLSGFQLVDSAQGARYRITLDETLRRGRRLSARFEWVVAEGDFDARGGRDVLKVDKEIADGSDEGSHVWNMVAPRCRVSGTITTVERDGRRSTVREFSGTGYHDHNRDRRWLPATVAEWQWGRAHFAGATAVFYRYRERGQTEHFTRLFLVRDGMLSVHRAQLTAARLRRHHFGLRYPSELRFETADESATLRVSQTRVLDGSYFYLRFDGEAALDTRDARTTRRAHAITEHLAPRALRSRWLDWLTDMRIGRQGRASFLK
ncbi:MAG TPA: hypothetical protein VNA19_01125 [Pyrinomonadaceae bacterium]|nr:hypothetical protein [Pyrinomonadaceae bacterium]